MFQSRVIAQKLSQLTSFLTCLADQIILTQFNVQSKQFKLNYPFLQYYTIVYDFCIQKPSLQQKMLQSYKNILNYFIQKYMEHQNQLDNFQLQIKNSKKIIKRFNLLWLKYTKFMVIIAKKVYTYLDRYYLPGIQQGSLYKIGINIIQKNICHQTNIQFFYRSFIKQIKQIRTTKIIPNYQLLRFTQALAVINMEKLLTELIKIFIDQTILYYKLTYNRLQSLSYSKYLQSIYNISLFQKVLFDMCVCLNIFQRQTISKEIQEILIKPITEKFIKDKNEIKKMFNLKNIQYMRLITYIYKQYQGFGLFRQGYYNYLLQIGQQIFIKPQPKASLNSTDIIYAFYTQQINLITKGFDTKKSQLLVTLNNAIQRLISKKQHFTQQFYAYCMQILQNKKFNIKENKQKITIILQKMFSKDQFIGYYQNSLLKKLTTRQNFSIQTQQSFIQHLNQIYGNQLTHKLSKKIKDYIESNQNPIIKKQHHNINLTILSSYLWQKTFSDQLSFKLTLPTKLSNIWRQIQIKYMHIEPKKKLTLLCYQNKIILNIKLNKKQLSIKCNLIEASILLLISTRTYCSQTQIISTINMEKNIVQNILQKFEQTIPNLFIKTSLGDYVMNWHFNPQLNSIDMNFKQTSKDKIIKFIEQDRQILIQAAIVKYIKRTKQCKFQQIAQGVINSIRLFKPQIQNIKKSVEKLIKKGYIQENEGELLQYVQ